MYAKVAFSLLVVSLALIVFEPIAFSQTNAGQNIDLAQVVKRLGANKDEVVHDFNVLNKDPHEAVALLVGQLHPIACRVYYPGKKTKQSEHVINCLRALHYLTGVYFTAKTSLPLTDDQRQFLDFKMRMRDDNPEHSLHFFSVWMSRDADYVAPQDAQKTIIGQWQRWNLQYGKTFNYSPSKDAAAAMDDWYWWG
jgi:hypothetical protein